MLSHDIYICLLHFDPINTLAAVAAANSRGDARIVAIEMPEQPATLICEVALGLAGAALQACRSSVAAAPSHDTAANVSPPPTAIDTVRLARHLSTILGCKPLKRLNALNKTWSKLSPRNPPARATEFQRTNLPRLRSASSRSRSTPRGLPELAPMLPLSTPQSQSYASSTSRSSSPPTGPRSRRCLTGVRHREPWSRAGCAWSAQCGELSSQLTFFFFAVS